MCAILGTRNQITPMRILHVITYFMCSIDGQIRREQTAQLSRNRKLSVIGCERILKRADPSAIVTRVETIIDER